MKLTVFFVIVSFKYVATEVPRFRILAPQLVCPKDDHSPIVKPDNTVITIQTNAVGEFHMNWTVRWHPLDTTSQRFTVLLWRTARALETKLNGPQPEPFVYIIDDDELLQGVKYIFNVRATVNGETSEPQTFYINNTFGEQTLEAVGGLTEFMSVVLAGGQVTFADIEYVLEADVTTCVPFYDYHFSWKIQSSQVRDSLNISTIGSRLEIPPHSLQAGMVYDVICCILKDITDEVITQVVLPVQVGYYGLEVYLGAERMTVPIDHGFAVESTVVNHDYPLIPLNFHWRCNINGTECELFENVNNSYLTISSGFSTPGQYEITLIVNVLHQSAEAKVTITAEDAILPVIHIRSIARILNEGTAITLVANASNLTPICTLRWYFDEVDKLDNISNNDNCDERMHGTPLSDAVTVFSLDENFLYELTDYSNETEWREVTAELDSSTGRARFVVKCNCSLALGCATKACVHADVNFKQNKGPVVGDITVSPSSGTAVETIFRVSLQPAADPDGPLRYSFHCSIGNNNTILLGSFLEHLAVETFLPYLADGTEVWAEVCDVRGACSQSDRQTVHLLKGEARSLDILKAEISSHVQRCEIILLQRTALTAIATYKHAGQTEALSVFTTSLLDSVPMLGRHCISQYYQQYLELLNKLADFGVDMSGLN